MMALTGKTGGLILMLSDEEVIKLYEAIDYYTIEDRDYYSELRGFLDVILADRTREDGPL